MQVLFILHNILSITAFTLILMVGTNAKVLSKFNLGIKLKKEKKKKRRRRKIYLFDIRCYTLK